MDFHYYMIPLDLYIKCPPPPHSAGLLKVNDEIMDGVMNVFHYILNPPSFMPTCSSLFFVCIINSHALSKGVLNKTLTWLELSLHSILYGIEETMLILFFL